MGGHRLEILEHLATRHADDPHGVAEGQYGQHILVGDLARGQRGAHATCVHHAEVGLAGLHGGCGDQASQVGLGKAHHVAITLQLAVALRDRDVELRLALFLIGAQEFAQFAVLGNFLRDQHLPALAILLDGLLEIHRNQLIVDHGQLAIAELVIGASHVLAPFMRLHDVGAVLSVRLAIIAGRKVRHPVGALHADRLLGVATDDHVQFAVGQITRQRDIARRIDAMLGILIVAHVGDGEDQVRLLMLVELLDGLARLFLGVTEVEIAEVFGVADTHGVFGGQADHRDLDAMLIEDLPGREQALAAGLVVDVGGQHREVGPVALLEQHLQRVVEFMVAHRHGVVADAVHALEVGFGLLEIGFRYAGIDVATRQQQHAAACGFHLGADAVDQRLARRHAVFAITALPEATVVVVGMQHRQVIGGVGLPFMARLAGTGTQRAEQCSPQQGLQRHARAVGCAQARRI